MKAQCDSTNAEHMTDKKQLSPLTITALDGKEVEISFEREGCKVNKYAYRVDNGKWKAITEKITSIRLGANQKAQFKCISYKGNNPNRYMHFTADGEGKVKVSGFVSSMYDTEFDKEESCRADCPAYACYGMFSDFEPLIDASELQLPATKLAESCYQIMFSGCKSLIKTPKLQAAELGVDCYRGMFSDCKSLENAPELPAATLAAYCYCRMFSGCVSLIKAPKLPSTDIKTGCYASMFSRCTSLTDAPELLYTGIAQNCYVGIFSGCKLVDKVTCHYAPKDVEEDVLIWVAKFCFEFWLADCSESGAVWLKKELVQGMSDKVRNKLIPTGWKVNCLPE